MTDTCTFKKLFLYFIDECNDFYSIAEEDQNSFLPGWKKIENDSGLIGGKTKKGPWEFQSGDELETYPYWGYKATYSAGGKLKLLSPSYHSLRGRLSFVSGSTIHDQSDHGE